MPAYNKNPYPIGNPPVLMVAGRTEYLYGGFSDTTSATTFSIQQVTIASNVATLNVTLTGGTVPAVGSLVSVQGTQTDSGVANVTNVALTAVTINSLTGVGTISYAATGSNQSATADSGLAVVPQPITYDTLAVGASKQAASAENDPSTDDERAYFAQVFFGTIPTSATVVLEASLVDTDSAYQIVGTVATVTGGAVTLSAATFSSMNYKFLRFAVTALSGTGTIAAALMG